MSRVKRGEFWPTFYHCDCTFGDSKSVMLGERCQCATDSHSELWQWNTYSRVTGRPACGSWVAELCHHIPSWWSVIICPQGSEWFLRLGCGVLRPVLTGHLKKQKVSKDVTREDLRMSFGDLWGSRPTPSYLEAAPRALHPLDSSGYVSCDSWA